MPSRSRGAALGHVAIGVGVLILIPKLSPSCGRALAPVAKEAIKAGMAVYDRTVATVTERQAIRSPKRAELESDVAHREAQEERPTAPAFG